MGLRKRSRPETKAERAAYDADRFGDDEGPARRLIDLPPGVIAGVVDAGLSVKDATEMANAAQDVIREVNNNEF